MSKSKLPVQSDLSVELQGEDIPLNNIQLVTKEMAYERLAIALEQFADLDTVMSFVNPDLWRRARDIDDWLVKHKVDSPLLGANNVSLGEFRWKAMELRKIYDDFALQAIETPLQPVEATISPEPIPTPTHEEIDPLMDVSYDVTKRDIFHICQRQRNAQLDVTIQEKDPGLWQSIESLYQWLWKYECDPIVDLERYLLEARVAWSRYTLARQKYSS